MPLIDTDKNGLGAGSQPGSAEVLLGSSLLEQHPTALIETPLQSARAAFVIYFFEEDRRAHRANSFK